MPREPAPAGNIAVISVSQEKACPGGAQQSDIGHRPVITIHDDEIVLTVSIQIGFEEPIIPGEPAPAGDVAVVARDELESAGAVGDEQTEIGHHPIDAIENGYFVDAVAIEVANH